MRDKSWSLVFALALIPLVTADSAAGSDRKFYAGVGCVALYGQYQTHIRYDNYRAENYDTADPHSVVCPVIRDDTTDNPSITDFDVWVDGNIGETTQCWGYARSYTGAEQATDTDSTTLDGARTLTFGADPDTSGDGYVYLRCSLPARSGSDRAAVIGYAVTELSG